MAQISKPNSLNKVWASGGDRATPLDSKITSGWQIEIPPRQWFNWLDNRQDQAIAHINQHGIAVWDAETEYQAGKSYTQDPTTGTVYRCLVTNTGNPPSTSPAQWVVAFSSSAGSISEADADAKYVAKWQNLNDLPNKSVARTNLGVYSRTEVDSQLAGSSLSDFTGANQSKSANGFQNLPGGLILQWGTSSIPLPTVAIGGTVSLGSISFPKPFPSTCVMVMPNVNGGSSSGLEQKEQKINLESTTRSSFTLSSTRVSGQNDPGQLIGVYWFAIGY